MQEAAATSRAEGGYPKKERRNWMRFRPCWTECGYSPLGGGEVHWSTSRLEWSAGGSLLGASKTPWREHPGGGDPDATSSHFGGRKRPPGARRGSSCPICLAVSLSHPLLSRAGIAPAETPLRGPVLQSRAKKLGLELSTYSVPGPVLCMSLMDFIRAHVQFFEIDFSIPILRRH